MTASLSELRDLPSSDLAVPFLGGLGILCISLTLLFALEADVLANVGILILFIVGIIASLYELSAVECLFVFEGGACIVFL